MNLLPGVAGAKQESWTDFELSSEPHEYSATSRWLKISCQKMTEFNSKGTKEPEVRSRKSECSEPARYSNSVAATGCAARCVESLRLSDKRPNVKALVLSPMYGKAEPFHTSGGRAAIFSQLLNPWLTPGVFFRDKPSHRLTVECNPSIAPD